MSDHHRSGPQAEPNLSLGPYIFTVASSSLPHSYTNKQQSQSLAELIMGGGSEEVKVLGGWASPFVMRPRIALNLKGVGYEFLQETFGSKSELLLKSNPVYKKIPVLIHNGKSICESMIIVEYVDEVWSTEGKPSILPSDPYDRAIARFWAVYVDDKVCD